LLPLAGVKVNRWHGVVVAGMLLSIVVAVVTYFMPQHAVREMHRSPGCSVGFGFHMCDDPDERDRPCVVTPGELGPGHSAADHTGLLPLVFFWLLLGGVIVTLVVPRARWIPFVLLLVVAMLLVSMFDLAHLLEPTETLPAGEVHGRALVGILLGVPLLCVVQLVAYRTRRGSPPPPLAPARLVRRLLSR
jgi:hypothetical protein